MEASTAEERSLVGIASVMAALWSMVDMPSTVLWADLMAARTSLVAEFTATAS